VIRNAYNAFTIDSSTPTLRINLNEGTVFFVVDLGSTRII
jgi:hypothetical protein